MPDISPRELLMNIRLCQNNYKHHERRCFDSPRTEKRAERELARTLR